MSIDAPSNIAVIGSGAAGLTAAHLLQRKHRVTLFEKESRLGGHTHTVTVDKGPDAGIRIDTGFIVMNHRNYPLLTKLFEQLDVGLDDSDMSFSYHDVPSGLQYSGGGLNGLFAQRTNLIRPSFHRMVKDTLRFFKTAEADLTNDALKDLSLGEYMKQNQFGPEFIHHHLIPMGSAIWSTPCESMLEFPAWNFLQFFKNHGLLSLNDRPQWKAVVGGSSTYIRQMQKNWQQVEVRTDADIAGIRRNGASVEIQFRDGGTEIFDHVILASHADQSLELLLDPTPEEQTLLGCWTYTGSKVHLHTDTSVMPSIRRVWSSWNFHRIRDNQTCLTYHMNRLQNLNTELQYFVSLNLPEEPKEIVGTYFYTHPMFTREALRLRPRLTELNGVRNTWYAGSYFGNGFHEDAVRSAVDVAEAFGIAL